MRDTAEPQDAAAGGQGGGGSGDARALAGGEVAQDTEKSVQLLLEWPDVEKKLESVEVAGSWDNWKVRSCGCCCFAALCSRV